MERTYKSISTFRYGLDEARPISRISQSFSQSGNRAIQTMVKVNKRVGGPEFLTDLFPRNYLTHSIQ
jgi:hypothetical protein